MRVPAHLQEISRKLGLRSWVNHNKDFPKAHYFKTIDDGKTMLEQFGEVGADRDEFVVRIIATALDVQGMLLTHVLEAGTYDLDTEDREMTWLRACQAAGWVVLQAYELACKNNEWPPGEGDSSDA